MVGCGLIGRRRAETALGAGDDVTVVCDVVEEVARETAERVGAEWTADWRTVVGDDRLDAVVVSTVNRHLAEISVAALDAGRHVLCEKPLGRSRDEATQIRDAALRSGRVLKTGFNHRHHPAIAQAHALLEAGAVGPVHAVRGAYGHGGRPGYESEWRADPELAGGGELLDQGVHLIDLCRWFAGEVVEVAGAVATSYWPIAPLEDNAFALLHTADGAVASLHTSWTQWRNLFRFEVFGTDGYLVVEGLGGSYGTERLVHGVRREQGGRPDERSWDYPDHDVSWAAEWAELRAAIAEGREPLGSGEDGYRAACVIDAIYESAAAGSRVVIGDGR